MLISCMCKCAGARVDTWVETGTEILPFFDSLLAKLMVHGSSRQDAVAKLQEALANTIIGGIPSNLEYLETIADSESFAAGHLAHPLFALLRICCDCGLPVLGLSSMVKGSLCILKASLVLHQTGAPSGSLPVLCPFLNGILLTCPGATTTRFLEGLLYCPKAIEVLDPGMSTTVQVRPSCAVYAKK